MEAAEILTQNVDRTKLPPLHQKRILAFVNHFLISSCSFLNEFSLQCETKFIELERKLQKVEAALTILESKLASIPDAENKTSNQTQTPSANGSTETDSDVQKTESTEDTPEIEKQSIPQGVLVTEHSSYKKFFKMIQVGVPLRAVQMKMQAEGIDASILENPNAVIPSEADATISES